MDWKRFAPLLVTVLVAPAFFACATSQSADSARTSLAAVTPVTTSAAAPDTTRRPPDVLTAQPIEPILAGPLKIGELTPQSATLNITTNRDVACVVVFGMDPGFGQLALDRQMGSSAHSDHRVVMRGLQPDTEYVYRLQGSDPDGAFYASSTMRFRTPPAEPQADLGTNVARAELGARIVDVSSNFDGGDNASSFGANNAIDGDDSTEWSSAGDGNQAFVTVELPQAVEVSGFGLWTRTMGTSAQIGRFEVENEAGEIFGPFAISDPNQLYGFAATGRGRRFTFRVVDSSGGNTGVVEIGVFTRGTP